MAWWNSYSGLSPHEKFVASKERMRLAGIGADSLGSVIGLTPDDKKEMEFLLSNTPGAGDILNARDSYNQMDDYLRNRGMSWSDLKYPSRTPYSGGVGSAARHGINFVSRNIEKLYDDRSWKPRADTQRYGNPPINIRYGYFGRYDY